MAYALSFAVALCLGCRDTPHPVSKTRCILSTDLLKMVFAARMGWDKTGLASGVAGTLHSQGRS